MEEFYEEYEDICLDFIEIEKIYDLLVTEQDIENMISKLEKLEILGENILKYWDKDKVFCEIKIKNPRKINNNDKRSTLVECTNEDLLEIDEYISDKESVYSIISIEDIHNYDNLEEKSDYENFIQEFSNIRNLSDSEEELEYMDIELECKHNWIKDCL